MAVNRTIRHLIVGNALGSNSTAEDPTIGGAVVNPSYCIALETLTLTVNGSVISKSALKNSSGWPNTGGLSGCPNLSRLIISEGVTRLSLGDVWDQIYCVCPVVELPSTIEMIGSRVFGNYCCSTIVCRALVPPEIFREGPTLTTDFYDAYGQMGKMILYVPAESIDVYKTTSGWSNFGTILPIDE